MSVRTDRGLLMKNDLFIRALSIDWNEVEKDSYLRHIPALKDLDFLQFRKNVTFFVGENGSGKSTLLEAIAVSYGFNAEGGTKNYNFSTYNDLSGLAEAIRLSRGIIRPLAGYFFRAESFFNVATAIMEKYNDDGFLPDYHKVSHGESFLDFMSHSSRQGIYLMDEPEAALSPQRQLTLLLHIIQMARFWSFRTPEYARATTKKQKATGSQSFSSRTESGCWTDCCMTMNNGFKPVDEKSKTKATKFIK